MLFIKRLILKIAGGLFCRLRMSIYRYFGICDKTQYIGSNCYIDNPKCVKILGNGFVNHDVVFNTGDAKEDITVTIGKRVWIGPYVKFICVSHEMGNSHQRAGQGTYGSISVGDGTWIGANVTILQGVNIGKGCVIGAGAVVNKDVPDNEMWGGVPAKFIKNLSTD